MDKLKTFNRMFPKNKHSIFPFNVYINTFFIIIINRINNDNKKTNQFKFHLVLSSI